MQFFDFVFNLEKCSMDCVGASNKNALKLFAEILYIYVFTSIVEHQTIIHQFMA